MCCLYPKNVKPAEPRGPNFFVTIHVTSWGRRFIEIEIALKKSPIFNFKNIVIYQC